ncbi:MAG: D-alanyl-D-alanine dipeptidase [Alphaproteobacteria bacterium]|nr:D-alanyl-D-alanine dipeptidase [Alphaproteobacteria bacterium]
MLAEIAQIIPIIKPKAQPFHSIVIKECAEPLVVLSTIADFSYETPAPYEAAGAPYNGISPFSLRTGNAQKLGMAQAALQQMKPGWRFKIFDAYRPVPVQAYMVAHSFYHIAKEQGLEPLQLTASERDSVLEQVYRIWSPPNTDPLTPPPHSTGAAIDVTLVDAQGAEIDMGSPIDFNGDESNPDFFKNKNARFHANRMLLCDAMTSQGFVRHHTEWWHFSYGDQYWAWSKNQNHHAIYGRI